MEFLKTQQDKVRGNWPEHIAQPGGLTALCTLALLNAGVRAGRSGGGPGAGLSAQFR